MRDEKKVNIPDDKIGSEVDKLMNLLGDKIGSSKVNQQA